MYCFASLGEVFDTFIVECGVGAETVVGVFGLEIGFGSCLALVRLFSKVESRDAMSAMMVFLDRRTRGPGAGYEHGLLALVQWEHGRFLSHRIFL